jgi:hypothetical protein
MGTVINFPEGRLSARRPRPMPDKSESAAVIILPVVRIERHGDAPSGDFAPEASAPRRRRRRRANRS